MQFLDRKLSIAFSTVTLGAALLLAGCDEEPAQPANNNAQAAAPLPADDVTPGSTDGMPPVIFLRGATTAFTTTDASINQQWSDHWEQEAQPHHTSLMQVPENAALFQNFVQQFDSLKNASLSEKLQAVNQAVNDYVTYTADSVLYGRSDYWASPVETLKTHRGDCEDFAILKYYTLKAMGVDDNRMFLTAVNMSGQSQGGPDHLVLLVNTGDRAGEQSFVMLDNNSNQMIDGGNIGYSIYHAFNDTGYWGYKPDYLAMAAATPVKTENNGRVVEQDGALIIDGGKVVVQKDGTVLVNNPVKPPVAVANRQTAQAKMPG